MTSPPAPRAITVAGAGIGGLSAALALARRDIPVRVIERAAEISEVGAGLQLGPNAMHVLARLGLAEAVEAAGFTPEHAVIRDGRRGWTLFRMPLGARIRARHGAPFVQIHRADLQGLLLEACRAAGVEVETGTRLDVVSEGAQALQLGLATGETRVTAGLVGADGLHSTVRKALFGPADVRFTGNVCWRATVPAEALPPGLVSPDATIWAGPGAHVVTYYLRGGSLVNIVAVREGPWAAESWTAKGDPEAMRAAFAGWHPGLRRLLDAVEECWLWALCDRPPMPSWGRGRTVLLGDACHPMLPFLAQGAAMAIEDAWVLAASLERTGEISAGFADYAARRHARATKVQARAAGNAALFHAEGARTRLVRFGPMALATRLAPSLFAPAFDWLYGTDVTRER
ncbi:FAD-dependent monooxygenase [Oceanicella sp. SM1341]|uniref:FAD-dependent monooxygenase n=1 Tax=Oceanicella sp. SM1341 TaxID=1548889 RepID=UPI000E4D1982|nr:FAD-dependent monooxygenase [Oceanicella sp. SM1341]